MIFVYKRLDEVTKCSSKYLPKDQVLAWSDGAIVVLNRISRKFSRKYDGMTLYLSRGTEVYTIFICMVAGYFNP